MSDAQPDIKPYVGPEENIPEATWRAVILGLILAVVLGSANVYLGLYAGMTVSASIPAAVVSMAILRGIFRTGTILENNIAQTIASTAESLAAGAIFTIPAMLLVGAWQEFQFWPTTLIIMTGGLLGVIFMVPLRRALIIDRKDLTYPEGVACSEVLIVGQQGGSGIKTIALGLGIGAVFKLLVSGFGVIKGTVEVAAAKASSVFYFGSDMSPALVAVGYIVNIRVAFQVFLGGMIGWFIGVPLLQGVEPGAVPLDAAWDLWDSEIRYIGVGTMLVGGIYSIWSVRHGVFSGLSSLKGISGKGGSTPNTLRTERDMSLIALMSIFWLTVIATLMLYNHLIGSFGTALAAGFMMIIAAFLFVAVATYIVGLVGSSNSPVSGMTICALLMTAGVLMALGIRGESAIMATLGVAGVVCCAACTAGDIAQDLKTGQLVGATPVKQQWAEVLGVVAPAFVFAPVMGLLHNQYGIGDGLRAPQATLFASLTEGFFGEGDLPWTMVQIGAVVGVAIIAIDAVLQRTGKDIRLHIMPIAVGIYLPLALTVPIFIGGVIRKITSSSNATPETEASDKGILYGSGIIAGEALMGIGLALVLTLGLKLRQFDITALVSVILFTLFLTSYWAVSRKRSS